MKRIGYHCRTFTMMLVLGMTVGAAAALAAPVVNGVNIKTRIFNDCPSSTVTTTNLYPVSINIDDSGLGCFGFANLHNWSFSSDGGTTAAYFDNGDEFHYCATLVIDGVTNGEAGLRLSPWYGQDVDGRFNVRVPDGEVACFGGRLPFYSFTANHGVVYVKGTPITLDITYLRNGLSSSSPATIVYSVTYNAISYSSGPLPFDEGNVAEGAIYGNWGILDDARVGGYIQCFLVGGNPAAQVEATWSAICYEPLAVTPTQSSSWGRIKTLYR